MCLCSNACASIVDLIVLNLLYVDIGMSQKIVSGLRLGRRLLSKIEAKELSLKIQVPFEQSNKCREMPDSKVIDRLMELR